MKWRPTPGRTYKYDDDNIRMDKICMEGAPAGDDGTPFRDKHAIAAQNSFRTTIRRAEGRGMKVNGGKTAVVCLSGAQSYEARSHLISSDRSGQLCQGDEGLGVSDLLEAGCTCAG